ncbi:hypothetical protein EV586_107117 [Tumebacillus sp. BK434]|nr:hypothetical protein EV586_107117 [Tumebacillus sp. BK434]
MPTEYSLYEKGDLPNGGSPFLSTSPLKFQKNDCMEQGRTNHNKTNPIKEVTYSGKQQQS